MSGNGRLISLFLILLVIFGALYYFLKVMKPKAVYHQAIRLSLSQTGNNQLSLNQVSLEAIYPEKEQSNPAINEFYQAKVVARDQEVLYSTQIAKAYQMMAFTYPGYEPPPPQTLANNEIDIYLPVYPQAEKAVIEDELGNTILSINLKTLDTESLPTTSDLCGNAICDRGENRISCDADCQ